MRMDNVIAVIISVVNVIWVNQPDRNIYLFVWPTIQQCTLYWRTVFKWLFEMQKQIIDFMLVKVKSLLRS